MKKFEKGDWALLYDSRFKDFKGILCTRWLGPYEFNIVFDNGTMNLVTIESVRTPLLPNGHRLRLYHKPTSKDSFINVVTYSHLHITGEEENSPVLPNY